MKAIAIYRDGSKTAQPLAKKSDGGGPARRSPLPRGTACPTTATRSDASSASATTRATSTSASIDDGTPGDVFVDIAKEGTTLAGLMNCFMIAVSIGLQYGVPLDVWVSKFAHMRFEPSGMTNDEDIRIAKSIPDYVFRWMGKKFLDADQQEEIGILSPEVRARLAAAVQRHRGRGRAGDARLPRRPHRARPRSSTRGRTRRSAPSAAAA